MKNISNNGKKENIQHEMTVQLLSMNTFLVKSSSFTLKTTLNFKRKLYVMDKSGYDFRIQRAEIDKEDIKYFKQ
jgi:hypothetical protein